MSAPCPNASVWRASCKRRTCPTCGPRWARDWRNVMFANLTAYGRDVALVSITPPGKEHLPWDAEACSHPRGGRHDGKRGCRIQGRAARMFNETATHRYAELRRAAAAYTRRHAPVPANLLERVWEPQARGVLHLHLVLGAGTPAELEAAAVFVGALKRLAPEYGFGFVDARGRKKSKGRRVVVAGEVLKLIAPQEAARYLSSYLTGRSRYKASLRETIADPTLAVFSKGQSVPIVWLTPKLTSIARGGTGVTMRTLRRARHLWAWVKGVSDTGPRWVNTAEAAIVGATYRRLYARRQGDSDDDVDAALAQALALAQDADDAFAQLPPPVWGTLHGFRVLYASDNLIRQRAERHRFANVLALGLAGLSLDDRPAPLLAAAA